MAGWNEALNRSDNILAVLEGYIHRPQDDLDHGLVFKEPTAALFLGNKPSLHVIPVEHSQLDEKDFVERFNSETGGKEKYYNVQPLDGTDFVADYFDLQYDRFSGRFVDGNKAARITNFEDGRDKIMLDVGADLKYWWRKTAEPKADYDVGDFGNMSVITLYNRADPIPRNEDHVIARILDFDGTFSDDDFIRADGSAVDSSLIIELPNIV